MIEITEEYLTQLGFVEKEFIDAPGLFFWGLKDVDHPLLDILHLIDQRNGSYRNDWDLTKFKNLHELKSYMQSKTREEEIKSFKEPIYVVSYQSTGYDSPQIQSINKTFEGATKQVNEIINKDIRNPSLWVNNSHNHWSYNPHNGGEESLFIEIYDLEE